VERPAHIAQVEVLIREIQRYLALVEALRRGDAGGGRKGDDKRT
jgi:hypothetical protein